MNPVAGRGLILALMAVGVLLPGGPVRSDSWPEEWSRPMEPFRIVGNVFYVGTEGVGAYLIVTPRGHILIDGGAPRNAPLIAASIRKLGFKVSDIKYLLNSHAHVDHAGGLAELKRLSGALMIASAADRPALEAGRVGYGPSADWRFTPVKVDRTITDNGAVSLGGSTLYAHLTPGHTKGCTTWTMKVPDGRRMLDVMFYCSTTTAGANLIDDPKYPNAAKDFRLSFRKLETMRADVFLANHGEFFGLMRSEEHTSELQSH